VPTPLIVDGKPAQDGEFFILGDGKRTYGGLLHFVVVMTVWDAEQQVWRIERVPATAVSRLAPERWAAALNAYMEN
jgi:hypothetical protein